MGEYGNIMDSDSDREEPPSKKHRYERSSTPIKEQVEFQEPPDIPPLNGKLEEAETPLGPAADSSMEQGDTLCPDEEGLDYSGISNEAMGKLLILLLNTILGYMHVPVCSLHTQNYKTPQKLRLRTSYTMYKFF